MKLLLVLFILINSFLNFGKCKPSFFQELSGILEERIPPREGAQYVTINSAIYKVATELEVKHLCSYKIMAETGSHYCLSSGPAVMTFSNNKYSCNSLTGVDDTWLVTWKKYNKICGISVNIVYNLNYHYYAEIQKVEIENCNKTEEHINENSIGSAESIDATSENVQNQNPTENPTMTTIPFQISSEDQSTTPVEAIETTPVTNFETTSSEFEPNTDEIALIVTTFTPNLDISTTETEPFMTTTTTEPTTTTPPTESSTAPFQTSSEDQTTTNIEGIETTPITNFETTSSGFESSSDEIALIGTSSATEQTSLSNIDEINAFIQTSEATIAYDINEQITSTTNTELDTTPNSESSAITAITEPATTEWTMTTTTAEAATFTTAANISTEPAALEPIAITAESLETSATTTYTTAEQDVVTKATELTITNEPTVTINTTEPITTIFTEPTVATSTTKPTTDYYDDEESDDYDDTTNSYEIDLNPNPADIEESPMSENSESSPAPENFESSPAPANIESSPIVPSLQLTDVPNLESVTVSQSPIQPENGISYQIVDNSPMNQEIGVPTRGAIKPSDEIKNEEIKDKRKRDEDKKYKMYETKMSWHFPHPPLTE